MKNTTMKVRCLRRALARRKGRISSMDAPVVPIQEAMAAPSASSAVFTAGVPWIEPRSSTPPETVYSDQIMIRKGT